MSMHSESGKIDHTWDVEIINDETGHSMGSMRVIAPTMSAALEKARDDFESTYPHYADIYMLGSIYDNGAIQ